MASEAILIIRQEDPIDFTVADGTGIEKGALLGITDPKTASNSVTGIVPPAGIAAREKIASDGRTALAVYRKGVFDLTLSPQSGTVTAGDAVAISGANTIVSLGAQVLTTPEMGKYVLGRALESASAQGEEVIQVAVNI